MEHDDITVDELLKDMLESLGDQEPPRQEDGWFTLKQMCDVADGMSEWQLRRALQYGVEKGTHERMVFANSVYYRKVKADNKT